MNDETSSLTTTAELDYKAIEYLVVDNPDLERLEVLLDQFNIFEAIGAPWQVSRHSSLLAFLLNPQGNHRLGDQFIKRFLQKAVVSAYDVQVPINAIDLDVWDMDQIIVLRESQRIDILLLDERHRIAVIIENRLTGRSSEALLQRYWDIVSQSHPGWSIIGLYLTPDGEPAPDNRYIPIDYGMISILIEQITDRMGAVLDHDVGIMLNHYTEMLRRHIVGESEITRLCRRIYGKHQRAFDLIYEHRLSRQKAIRNIIKLLIEQKQGLLLDHTQERYTGFAIQEWEVPLLINSRETSRPGRMLLFQFDTWIDTLPLSLYIGPGMEQVRQRLLEIATAHQPPFVVDDTQLLTSEWVKIFERDFLTTEFYEDASADELAEKILQSWSDFLKNDLPSLHAVLEKQPWIWKGAKGS
jgi:hypothetical protein